MSPERIVLCLGGFVATIMLVKLMLRRQRQLIELLRANSDSKLEWSRKKARAALMARRAASHTAAAGAARSAETAGTTEPAEATAN